MLNANIPPIECYVRGEYLRNLEDSFDKKFAALIFGVASIPGKVPLFHFLMEDGGVWWRMPISAFCWRKDADPADLYELVLWDSYSYFVNVTTFDLLKNKKISYLGRSKKVYKGNYLFTLDWAAGDSNILNSGFSEEPGQHKCGHVIKLDNGNFAIQPNNRIRVHDPSFVTKPKELLIERKLNSHVWTVEDKEKWITSDNDKYEYAIIDTEDDKNNL